MGGGRHREGRRAGGGDPPSPSLGHGGSRPAVGRAGRPEEVGTWGGGGDTGPGPATTNFSPGAAAWLPPPPSRAGLLKPGDMSRGGRGEAPK